MNYPKGFTLNIQANEVVDREMYIDEILSIIENASNSNVVIIMAESAIGKSCLVDKLLVSASLKQEKIRVRTLPLNNSEKMEEWEFLTCVFNEISKTYQNTADSFEAYIRSLKNNSANKDILNYINLMISKDTGNERKLLQVLMFLSVSWLFKLGKFNIENIINDNSINAISIKAQYIKYIIRNHNIVLAVDNIQNVDRQSMREIINIINETKKNGLQVLFEYTITDKFSKDLCNKFAQLIASTSVATKIIQLDKIDSKYIVDIVSKHMLKPNLDWDFNVKLQKQYQLNNNGNIREMLDFGICYNPQSSQNQKSEKYSLRNILLLSESSKQLLSLIICANNSISLEMLKVISAKINLEIDSSLQNLKNRLLVVEKNDKVILSHASLTDIWFENPQHFTFFDNISYDCLEKIYLTDINNDNSYIYDQSWLNLIQIYSRHKPEKLRTLFRYIDVDYKNMISKENAWKYMQKIVAGINDKVLENYNLYIDIIRYCFESELYKEGYSLIIEIEKSINTDLIIMYKSMYLSALDQHIDNIQYYEENIHRCNKKSSLYYNLKLIILSSYRSLHKLDKCYEIHKELFNDRYFKGIQEYAYFLRLCEMYLDRNKSLKYLKKSVQIFERNNNYIQAGKSLISYSYILATQGKLKRAEAEIKKAEQYLANKRMGSHMFLVNKAAIKLYKGDYSESVWQILNASEITAEVPFDKLAIIVNKLVWCIENKESDRYHLLIENAIELLPKEPDRHIHGLIYYNIYYLLKTLGDRQSEDYYSKAKKMMPYCKPLQARLSNTTTPETKFALKYKWHVCFLAYWTYDLL